LLSTALVDLPFQNWRDVWRVFQAALALRRSSCGPSAALGLPAFPEPRSLEKWRLLWRFSQGHRFSQGNATNSTQAMGGDPAAGVAEFGSLRHIGADFP
jgi:hypothetical protein